MIDFGQKSMDSIEIIKEIGHGTYGKVFKGFLKENNTKTIIAIKQIKKKYKEEIIDPCTLREISILKNLNHPNIIKLLDIIIDEENIFLLFEFMDYDLYTFLYNIKKQYIQKDLLKNILYQILDGVKYLHSNILIHRDLTLKNILLSNNGKVVKISDFGLSRKVSFMNKNYTKKVGTITYMAPEILLGLEDYSYNIDIWSVGCIFFEMLVKKRLFSGTNIINQIHEIENILGTPNNKLWPKIENFADYKKIYGNLTKESKLEEKLSDIKNIKAIKLIKKMIIYNPNDRISADNAINDVSFIFNFKYRLILNKNIKNSIFKIKKNMTKTK